MLFLLNKKKIGLKKICCFGCNLKQDDCRYIRRSIRRQIIDFLLEAKFSGRWTALQQSQVGPKEISRDIV
jgi:hypothetical protein